MDERSYRWTNKQMNKNPEEQRNGQTNIRIYKQTSGQTNKYPYK